MSTTPGAVLRAARERSRLSQSDLARRAGVAQSVISAYEADRRDPGLGTLTRLVEATGHELRLDVVPTVGRTLGLPNTTLGRRLRRHRRAVIHCAELRGASNVRVFGSVARGDETATSDIDLLVDLDPHQGLVALAALTRELTELLRVHVDVVPASSLKVAIRDEVFAEAVPL